MLMKIWRKEGKGTSPESPQPLESNPNKRVKQGRKRKKWAKVENCREDLTPFHDAPRLKRGGGRAEKCT